jgi:hypothetical protein
MARETVVVFHYYPFHVGQKIRLEGGHRRGDWEVIGVYDRKVRLRCPISHREVEWDRFCYLVEEKEDEEWPQRD